MSDYEPGTVAEVTWDNASIAARGHGKKDIRSERAIRTADGHWSLIGGWDHCLTDGQVDDVRPLVVLEMPNTAEVVDALRATLPCEAPDYDDQDKIVEFVAHTIEAQTKPPSIPEPGLWGVVKDRSGRHLLRNSLDRKREWLLLGTENHIGWDEIDSPTLIREGLS